MATTSKKQRCRDCGLLFYGGTRCADSRTDGMSACPNFKEGPPFQPKYRGKPVVPVEFDPAESHGWAFWSSPRHMLLLLWEVDEDGHGCWKLLQLAFNKKGLVTKVMREGEAPSPAFFGTVTVKSSGDNDLWASAGVEDDDELDYERTVTNKPREVHIVPARSDG